MGVDVAEKKLAALRRQAQELFFDNQWSRPRIARHLGVTRVFVWKWTQMPTRDAADDRRGLTGRAPKWTPEDVARVVDVARALRSAPEEFFYGATAVEQAFRRCYPSAALPPLRTIGRMLRAAGLTAGRRVRQPGAARYLGYPEFTVYERLGRRVLEVDCIGPRYLAGRTGPLHFAGFCFKRAPRLRHFMRIDAVTGRHMRGACERFFADIEQPDVVKVDNAPATVGSGSAPRTVSAFVAFLLDAQITPVFAVPRRPFSQAAIEGNNSVFARKFWRVRHFASVDEVDEQLRWFNEASRRYTGYQPAVVAPTQPFEPRIYFVRQVQHDPVGEADAYVTVVNTRVRLPQEFVRLFVLAEWHLGSEQLTVSVERNQELQAIVQMPFALDRRSHFRLGTG